MCTKTNSLEAGLSDCDRIHDSHLVLYLRIASILEIMHSSTRYKGITFLGLQFKKGHFIQWMVTFKDLPKVMCIKYHCVYNNSSIEQILCFSGVFVLKISPSSFCTTHDFLEEGLSGSLTYIPP